MRTYYSDNVMAFDVDDTLAHLKEGPTGEPTIVGNEKVIRKMREARFRNHMVVVWSAGGAAWAEQVVKDLNLEEYVDLIISKPRWCWDDRNPTDWTEVCNPEELE